MELIVAKSTREAEDVRGIELRASDGGALPAFSAGAHIDLHLPGGICRQDSLTNDPLKKHRYCLGVGLFPSSRAGSRFVHEQLDDDSDGRFPDLAGYLAEAPRDAHVYCCGPAPLMDAVSASAGSTGIPHRPRTSSASRAKGRRRPSHRRKDRLPWSSPGRAGISPWPLVRAFSKRSRTAAYRCRSAAARACAEAARFRSSAVRRTTATTSSAVTSVRPTSQSGSASRAISDELVLDA